MVIGDIVYSMYAFICLFVAGGLIFLSSELFQIVLIYKACNSSMKFKFAHKISVI